MPQAAYTQNCKGTRNYFHMNFWYAMNRSRQTSQRCSDKEIAKVDSSNEEDFDGDKEIVPEVMYDDGLGICLFVWLLCNGKNSARWKVTIIFPVLNVPCARELLQWDQTTRNSNWNIIVANSLVMQSIVMFVVIWARL